MQDQIQWLYLSEASEAIGVPARTLQKRGARGSWQTKRDDDGRRLLYAVPVEQPDGSTLNDDATNAIGKLQSVSSQPSGLMHDPVTGRYLIRNGSKGAIVNQLPGRVEAIARAIHCPEAMASALANAGIGGSEYKVPRIRIRSQFPDAPPTMLHISTRDIHVGEHNGQDSYEELLLSRVSATLQWATVAHGTLEQIVITLGSDWLTVDNAFRQTTRGTQIPGAISPWECIQLAQRLAIKVIDLCRQVAPVVAINEQGNHDAVLGSAVASICAAWYRDCDDVEVRVRPCGDVWTAHEFYDVALFGHHGHRRSPTQVAQTVAGMFPQMWGRCRFRYVMMGHRHHHQSFPVGDAGGVEVIQTRSPSPPTEYEHSLGFVDDAQTLESFIFQGGRGLVTHRRAMMA